MAFDILQHMFIYLQPLYEVVSNAFSTLYTETQKS